MRKIFIAIALLSLICACNKKQEQKTEKIIGKPEIQVQDGRFTPEVMWALGKMGEKAVSPDGKQIAYTVTYYDMEENKGNAEIYLMNVDGSNVARITTTAPSEFNLVWKDDETLLFCRDTEIISMEVKNGKETTLASYERGFEGFKLAPDGNSVVYITTKPVVRPNHLDKLYAGLDKTTGRINEDLMYRHWDNWVDEYPQIFLAEFDGKKIDVEMRYVSSTALLSARCVRGAGWSSTTIVPTARRLPIPAAKRPAMIMHIPPTVTFSFMILRKRARKTSVRVSWAMIRILCSATTVR